MHIQDMIMNCTNELALLKGDRKQAAFRKLLSGFTTRLKLELARRNRGLEDAPLDPEIEQEYDSVLGERLRDDASARTNFAHIMAFLEQE